MKKTAILFGALLGLVSITANAQTATKTATATVNVKLHPIQTIIVNTPNVDLEYNTITDYEQGVNVDKTNHLTIYSTGAFAVTVNSDPKDLGKLKSESTDVTEDIDAENIYVTASDGTDNVLDGAVYAGAVSLKQNPTTLFSSLLGGVNKKVTVNYAATHPTDAYVNKYFNEQNPTVYTTTVIYTISAQ